jgi:hypothetical protein
MARTAKQLTKRQRALVLELAAIMRRLNYDYRDVTDLDSEVRTAVLQSLIREIVRGQVVHQYTLVDEYLGLKVCEYLFHGSPIRLWRTKSFERFNYFILEKMSLLEKLAFVRDVYNVPKSIVEKIESLNAIRNAVAHAFYPENLRAYRRKGKPARVTPISVTYKGSDLFRLQGLDRLLDETIVLFDFFNFRIKRKRKQVAKLHGFLGPQGST